MSTLNVEENDAAPGDLEQHFQLKLEIASMIRTAMQLFHEAKDEPREHQARQLLSRLAEDRFNLVVVGQFKRGKSSLMNAVMGLDRLPTGVLPLTSVVTTVRYGDRECVYVRTRGASLPYEVPLSKLQDYVTEKGNPGNRKQVVLAEVCLPAEVLRLGFHFIDTPGVGSAIAENTAATHAFLPEADAVVFVTGFESAMNEGEIGFLRTVARHVRKIFFVVNKCDLVSAEERDAVLDSIRKTISTHLGEAEPRIFAVSAREGLEAKLTANSDMLLRSGFPEFESALTEFLTTESARVSLLRSSERVTALLTPERLQSRADDVRTNLGEEAIHTIKQKWDHRIEQIQGEFLHTAETLRCQIRSELPSRVQNLIDAHCAEVRESLRTQVDGVLARREGLSQAEELRELAERADRIAAGRLRRWIEAHRAEFSETVWSLASETVDRLESLHREALGFAAELLGLLPSAGVSWASNKNEAVFSSRTATPFEWRPRFAWELELYSAEWLRKRVRRDYTRTLESAVAAYRARVIDMVAETGGEWAGRVSSEIQNAVESLASQVAAAIQGRAPSVTSRKAGELLERLDKMHQELADGRLRKPISPSPMPSGERPSIRSCFVCERVASEMFDFFSKRQYELAISESQQRTHAAHRGFCALHTWQYEHIASPHGVCLAYGPLLAALARHLRSIAASASSPKSMRDRIDDLYPSAARCAACQRTSEAERAALDQLRQSSADGNLATAGFGLCLSHLGALLDTEIDPEISRNFILDHAATLDRISQDMQTYALKHDAVQPHSCRRHAHAAGRRPDDGRRRHQFDGRSEKAFCDGDQLVHESDPRSLPFGQNRCDCLRGIESARLQRVVHERGRRDLRWHRDGPLRDEVFSGFP